jgi:6-phosphogluconolactonase (cycloisomerase 2 family)
VLQGRNDTSLAAATPLVAPTAQPDGSFTAAATSSVSGSSPYYTASARLRGPSAPLDLVTANYGSGTVSVLLGNGDGTFAAPVTYAVGSNPIALAIGDLNGDGKLDLAVANYGSGTVSVLLGNGDGTFQPAVTYTVGSSPRGVAIADLDGKNGNDLAVANWSSGNVSVLLNKGNGTFNSAVNYAVSGNPGNVIAADVNGDGKLDLVTANYSANSVSVLPGNGDGTFGAQVTFATGANTYPIDVVAVDLNGDGKLDLATANNNSGTVSVLLNQGAAGAAVGAATFAAPASYGIGGSYSYHLVAADLNGDGKADLAVANYSNGTVAVLDGNGDGTFQAAGSYSVGGSPIGIAAGDFNGDGITDLATANYSGNSVTVLLGNAAKPLPADAATGLMSGYGRGALLSGSNAYFSWTGKAGDTAYLAAEGAGASGYFDMQILTASGNGLTSFQTNSSGQGQSSPVTLPYSGTYYVEVYYSSNLAAEYRFRLTEVPPTLQQVTAYDGSVSSANAPTLANAAPGHLTATVAGYVGQADSSGEFFNLGSVVAGTTVNLTETQPANSPLIPQLAVYNSAGTLLNAAPPGAASLSYAVPAAGSYYAAIGAGNSETVSFWMDWNGSGTEIPVALGGADLWLYAGYFGFNTFNSDVYGVSWAGLANGWHQVTAVFSSQTQADQLYIDGVPQALSQKVGTTPAFAPFGGPASIGGDFGSYAFTGALQDVAFFSGALSSSQAQALYAARTGAAAYNSAVLGLSPGGYYQLSDAAGGVAQDSSGHGNNGTFGSGVTTGAAGYFGGTTAFAFSGGYVTATAGVAQPRGLLAQYVLALDVANTTPPQVTASTLPAQGTTSTGVINNLTLTFSEAMAAATVNNLANYALQDSGGHVYHLTSPGYTTGLTASYLISDGPLQPGTYTFSVSSGLTDRTGNALVPYTQSFTVAGVAPYVLQGRNDTSLAAATPLVAPTAQPDGSFTAGAAVALNASEPDMMASARLRGPGAPLDLITANYGSGTVSVLLGNGDGSFQAPVTYAVGSNPIWVAVGDLNGDGKLDLAVANYGSGTVSVLMGNGDGTFQSAVNYAVGSNPRGVAIADLDGKNGNDLVVSNWGSHSVSVLLNKGNGTFSTAVSYQVGNNPVGAAVADLNGDGKLDIAVANYSDSTVSVLPGNGDGTFGTQVTLATGANTNPHDVVAADLNSDGKVDLATANNNGTVSVLLNQGTPGAALSAGSFAAAASYSAGGSYSYHLVAADLNGDGKLDLAVADYSSSRVGVLLGNGDGTFLPAAAYTVTNPGGIAAGDFNGDGITDLAATTDTGSGSVTVLLGNAAKPLPADAATGLMSGYGRGALLTSSTDAFFSWTGKAGDKVYVASQTPGGPSGSGLSYYVLDSAGSSITSFSANSNGQGQSGPATLPYSGTYYVEVAPYYGWTGEYRFRVTEEPPALQQVTTYNGSTGSANTTTLANTAPGHLTATVAGYVGLADSSGEFFSLGNIVAGTTVNLTETQPANSGLIPVLGVYTGAGALLAAGAPGATALSYAVPAGGTYYAALNAGNVETVSFWMNWNGTNSEMPIGFSSYDLNLYNGFFGFNTANGDVYGVSSAGLANGWHHVTAVFATDPRADQLYIDGTQQALTQELGTTPAAVALSGAARISGWVNDGGYRFTGSLQDVAFFPRQLSAAEVQAEYAARNSAAAYSTAVLAQAPGGYYQLNESGGTVAHDSSGSGNDGAFGSGVTPGAAGALTGATAFAFSGGQVALTQPLTQPRGLLAQYVLALDVANTTPPQVTASTLPAQGTTSTAIIYSFNLNFSEDLTAASVNNTANYVLTDSNNNTYHVSSPGYTSGLSASYTITDGPLQPGNYTFTASGLTDRFGNTLAAPVVLNFTVANLANYIFQSRSDHTAASATPLTFVQDPAGAGLSAAAARGALTNGNDVDYYSFSGTAGNLLSLLTSIPGSPGGSELEYVVTTPSGSTLVNFYPNYTGQGVSTPIALPTTGTYTVAVHPYYGYYSEYDFRVLLAAPPLQEDTEPSNTLATAASLTLTTNGNSKTANVAGTILAAGDLNYYNLGTIQAGYSILLSTQLSATSGLNPVVSVYNASGVYQPKTNGRPFDSVGQIDITTTGTYYALMQGGNSTNGLFDQYVMNVQVVPTSSLAQLPNLEVTTITLPTASNIQSGQPVTFSWTETNAGQAATNVPSWHDRVVLSLDTTYGNSDDILLGVFPHTGSLNPGDSYTSTQTVTLPDGLSGNYHIIVQADANEEVNENAIGRGDGVTVSSGGPNNDGTFTVNLAPYPDLVVQGLQVNGPNADGTFSVSWNTVNNGNGAVASNWKEHLVIQDQTTGKTVQDSVLSFTGGLAANGGSAAHTQPLSGKFTVDGPGHFQVSVTTNSDGSLYEDNAQGHASAVGNDVSSTTFDATRDLQVAGLAVTSPASPQSGNTVILGWNDTDTGNLATSGSWNDSVTVVNTTTGATLVNNAAVPFTGAIQPGGQAAQSYSFALPDGAAGVGSIKVIVTTNANNAEAEYNTAGTASTNNASAPLLFASTLANYADLVVKSGSVSVTPAGPQSGNQLTVTWNDQNQGSAAVNAAFSDYVLVQRVNADNSLTTIASGFVVGNSTLVAGATSAPQTYRFTLPDGASGAGNFQVTVITDYSQSVKEYDANGNLAYGNNTASIDLVSTLAPYPDLQVTGLTVNPGSLQSGSSATITWNDANTGTAGVQKAFDDYVEVDNLTTGQNLFTSTVYYDPNVQGSLAAGASQPQQVVFRLPDGSAGAGNLRVTVTTDYYDSVYEYNAGGHAAAEANNSSSVSVTSTLPQYPDLQVLNLAVSPTAGLQSGDGVAITWNDANTGTGPVSGVFQDHVVVQNLTTGTTLTTADVAYDPAAAGNGPVAAGTSLAREFDYTLPQGTPGAGQLQVTVTTNYYHQVFEYNTAGPGGSSTADGNNSDSTTVTAALAPYADLVASDVTAPDLTVGDPAQVTITWKVSNHGTGPGDVANWVDAVIASPNDSPTGGTTLATFPHSGLLQVGGGYTQSQTIELPPHFEAHDHLFVQTDTTGVVFENGNKANNVAEAPNLFDVSPQPYADLVVSSVSGAATGATGKPLTLTWTVTNQGIGVTDTDGWGDDVTLTSDPAGKNVVVGLGSFDHEGTLGVGGSYTHTVDATLPQDLAAGTYYLAVHTGGPYEFIYTDNNTAVSGPVAVTVTPLPDLKPLTLTASPTTANGGDKVDVTWTVQNVGPGDASGNTWFDSLLLKQAGTNGFTDVGDFTYPNLLPSGKSYTRTEQVQLPSNTAGVFQFGLTTNNTTIVDPDLFTLTLPPLPDLQVQSVTAPDTAQAGGTVSLDFTVINQGTVEAAGHWSDSVYLSLDNKIDNGATLLGSFPNQAALGHGEEYKTTASDLLVPKRFSGPGYLIVQTNSGGLSESDTSNNTFVWPITITPLPPADLVTHDVAAADQAYDGSTLSVQYTVTNRGVGVTDESAWSDTIWLQPASDADNGIIPRPNPLHGDVLLATLPHQGLLGTDPSLITPPTSYTVNTTVTLPKHILGQYYITPWADSFDTVIKSTLDVNVNPDDPNELNNDNWKARPITVLLTPPPDLVVTSVTPPGHRGRRRRLPGDVDRAEPGHQPDRGLQAVRRGVPVGQAHPQRSGRQPMVPGHRRARRGGPVGGRLHGAADVPPHPGNLRQVRDRGHKHGRPLQRPAHPADLGGPLHQQQHQLRPDARHAAAARRPAGHVGDWPAGQLLRREDDGPVDGDELRQHGLVGDELLGGPGVLLALPDARHH